MKRADLTHFLQQSADFAVHLTASSQFYGNIQFYSTNITLDGNVIESIVIANTSESICTVIANYYKVSF